VEDVAVRVLGLVRALGQALLALFEQAQEQAARLVAQRHLELAAGGVDGDPVKLALQTVGHVGEHALSVAAGGGLLRQRLGARGLLGPVDGL
jgi:hypothetical protein